MPGDSLTFRIVSCLAATLIGVKAVKQIPQAQFYRLVSASLGLVSLKLIWGAVAG